MEGARGSSYRWVILGVTTFTQAGVSILQQVPAALGPVLTSELHITRTQVGFLSSAIWGGMLFTMLLSGILIDRRGERLMVLLGVSSMVVFAFAASFATSFVMLFLLLLVASLGASTSQPGGSKAIASWFPKERRGSAMGIRQTGVPLGGLIGALLLPPVAEQYGWSAGLRAAAGFTLITVVLFALLYRELPSPQVLSAKVGLRSILRNRNFAPSTGYAFLLVGAQGCGTAYLPLFLHQQVGMSVVKAGAMLAVMQVGGICGRIGWGVLSDWLGRRGPVMMLIGVIAALSSVGMMLLRPDTALLVPAVLAFLLGASGMGWQGLHLTLMSESVGVQSTATAMGLSLNFSFIGTFIAPPVFGYIADSTSSFHWSWIALAVWVSAGTLLTLLLREQPKAKQAAVLS